MCAFVAQGHADRSRGLMIGFGCCAGTAAARVCVPAVRTMRGSAGRCRASGGCVRAKCYQVFAKKCNVRERSLAISW